MQSLSFLMRRVSFLAACAVAAVLLTSGCAAARQTSDDDRTYPSETALVVSPRNVVRGAWAESWNEYLSRAVHFGFNGGVLVARDGEIVLRAGYGQAERSRRVPITPETVFYIGSLTKQFTAAGIMKLVDQNLLSVDDPITRFFGDVPVEKRDITVHQLLTHTSGLPSNALIDKYGQPVERDEQVAAVLESPLESEPGADYQYSNAGYSLLGAIIEVASGMDYERYLHDHLFQPSGMLHTGYVIPEWDRSEIAHGYEGEKDTGIPLDRKSWTSEGPTWAIQGAGGMMSTLDDLHRWHLALAADEVLSQRSTELLFRKHVQTGDDDWYGYGYWYGYGWVVADTEQGKEIAHNGSDEIYYAIFRQWSDTLLIGWTNQSIEIFHDVDTILAQSAVSGTGPATLPPEVATSAYQSAAEYIGTYQISPGNAVEILEEEGELVLQAVGQQTLAAITGLPSASLPAYAERNQLAKEFLGEVAGAINDPVESDTSLIGRMAAAVRRDTTGLGALLGSDLIGTLRAADGSEPRTYGRFRFREGNYVVELMWKDGKISGAGLNEANPVRVILRAGRDSDLIGFNVRFARSLLLRFDGGPENPTARLTVETATDRLIAVREPAL